ncbi:hypothetical protein KRE40_03785 [Elizabethkingia meningoseptica]|uniref:hypothetical protein n=1 Tax=Elizabethkingia meningoseptica TaxID=238 RepID=UPI0023B06C44|nr:hypothetical protein [Elizabethkingia meningoseptica]MDE5507772.1 hypothetical protein [Elizabethkingia meningoseptica]MDE5516383.1 hypothetical protein [Elizabethkingia meningoseptica]MDE5526625.1 hypothetical protein [Elizabethkingia meningoseptica]MDN4033759.1 hypothetical protein [Elizabethkingia meningoseptica]
MEKIIICIWVAFSLNVEVFLIVMADLWSGLRKAKKNKVVRSSYGLRRTVDKLGRYYNIMFPLLVLDAMQITAIWYLEEFYGYKIPIFPFISLVGAIGLSIIEIKSIYEKAEDKQRFHEAGALITSIAKNRTDIEQIAREVQEYMNNQSRKSNEKDNPAA